jgi:uncharacterized protein YkwD
MAQPVALRHAAAISLALGLCAAMASGAEAKRLVAPQSKCPGQLSVEPAAEQRNAIHCMVNYARQEAGVPPLRQSSKLQRSAARKGRDVLRCGEFTHTACGRSVFRWLRRVGYIRSCWRAGENLAWGTGTFATARSTVTRWLVSPAHRRVILNEEYRDFGVAVRRGSLLGREGVSVWVSHFGDRC